MKNLIRLFFIASVLFLFSDMAQAQYHTKVFLNNQELDYNTLVNLQVYTGKLLQGQYYIDNLGYFGVVGFKPAFNLKDMVQYKRALVDGNFPPRFRDPNPYMRESKFLMAQSTLTMQQSQKLFGKSQSSASSPSNRSNDYYERKNGVSRGRKGNTSWSYGNSFRGNNTGITTAGETTIMTNRSGKMIRTY